MVVRNTTKKQVLFEKVIRAASKVSQQFFIVDHGSTDNTYDSIRNISQKYHLDTEIQKEQFEGTMDDMKGKYYDILKQRKHSGSAWTHILILDWDEIITDELAQEIREMPLESIDIYYLNRHTYFLGKIISGDEYLPLLFKPESLAVGAFRKVHQLYQVLEGNWHTKKSTHILEHYSFESVTEAFEKTIFYAKIEGTHLYKGNSHEQHILLGFKLLFRATGLFLHSLFVRKNIFHIEGITYALWIYCSYLIQYMYYLECRNSSLKTPTNDQY